MVVTLLYFASLRDARGLATEQVHSDAPDLQHLYVELEARHGFVMPVDRLRVAVDGEFASWTDPLKAGSEIAFIPPVSGG